MFRFVHTVLLGAVVGVALVSYGLKEEVGARREALESLLRDQARLRAEIETLRAEWRFLSSPRQLRVIARRLWEDGTLRAADGTPLRPWTATQLLDLHAPAPAPSPSGGEALSEATLDAGAIETATIPR